MPNPRRRFAVSRSLRRGVAGFATAGVLLPITGLLPALTPAAGAAEPNADADLRPTWGMSATELDESSSPTGMLTDQALSALRSGIRADVDIADRAVTSRGAATPRQAVELDVHTLSKAMGGTVSLDRYRQLLPAFNEALADADATTVRRVAMFCAQVGHESVGLKYMEEIASGADYNGRVDLGNIHPGDGQRFKGRGPIQVTGRANYRTVSAWAHRQGEVPTRDYFLDHPSRMASAEHGFEGVVWYWTRARNMNAYADRNDIVGATEAVNGGTNGLDDRIARWRHCLQMGDDLLGT